MDGHEKTGRKPKKLETLGDVQRSLARLARSIERRKTTDMERAQTLCKVYQVLASVMQDRRDSLYQKRLKKLWDAHERGQSPAPAPQATGH